MGHRRGRYAPRLNSGVRRVTDNSLLSVIGPDGIVNHLDLDSLRASRKWSDDRICNEMAWFIASQFMEDSMSLEAADCAINCVRHYSLTRDPFISPEPCSEIYLAFDQGEFLHPSESPELDPVQTYTRPLLQEILARGYDSHA